MVAPGSSFYQAAQAILQGLGAPVTATTLNLLVAWEWCEKPHPDGAWQWNNPLNTTLPAPGSLGAVNAVGVQRFATPAQGVQAVVWTLEGRTASGSVGIDYYPTLRQALRQGNAAAFLGATTELTRWGGGDAVCVAAVYPTLPAPPSSYLSAPPSPAAPPPAAPAGRPTWIGWFFAGLGGLALLDALADAEIAQGRWTPLARWKQAAHTDWLRWWADAEALAQRVARRVD